MLSDTFQFKCWALTAASIQNYAILKIYKYNVHKFMLRILHCKTKHSKARSYQNIYFVQIQPFCTYTMSNHVLASYNFLSILVSFRMPFILCIVPAQHFYLHYSVCDHMSCLLNIIQTLP